MRILVTGAEGFVGSHLLPRLVDLGHEVVAAVRTGHADSPHLSAAGAICPFDLEDPESVAGLAREPVDGVVHLAGWSSTGGGGDPGAAYAINAGGTARVAEALAPRRGAEPVRFLHISTGLVYGGGQGHEAGARAPFRETDPVEPSGPYAGSKLASEQAALDVQRRTGLQVVIARSFSHTGAGQDDRFVVPAFARRIREAQRIGAAAIGVGNIAPVRDILHVEDVVDAYLALLERGRAGEVYNVASGEGISIRDLFLLVADTVGYSVVPEVDTTFIRVADPPYVVGDAGKLRQELKWAPRRTLAEAVREVVDAQAN